MYHLLRSILFLMDAEKVHYFSMKALRLINRSPLRSFFKNKICRDPRLSKNFLNIEFSNPVGLAAGFDKNAAWLDELDMLGFGSVETGTVTPRAQPGNEKPRLFRLTKDKAIINRMGFNNDGAIAVTARIHAWRNSQRGRNSKMIIGGNIGKNKDTPNEDAWKDYLQCFEIMKNEVDYFVINISSPNTPGLRDLQQKEGILKITNALVNANQVNRKPILLKIAPDLQEDEINEIIEAALQAKLDGLIISNTTISREGLKTSAEQIKNIGMGGLSGKPLKNKSDEMIRYVHQKTLGILPIIASGGIFNGDDAKEKIAAGASLVQIWTGFVYEGPSIVKNICKALVK